VRVVFACLTHCDLSTEFSLHLPVQCGGLRSAYQTVRCCVFHKALEKRKADELKEGKNGTDLFRGKKKEEEVIQVGEV
jgi:hypothetical protein